MTFLSTSSMTSSTQKLLSLKPHKSILLNCDLEITANQFTFIWSWQDPNNEITFPTLISTPQRTMDLWRDTCFEAFIQEKGGTKYYELNMAVNGNWNCFEFANYRTPRTPTESLKFDSVNFQFDNHRLKFVFSFTEFESKNLNISLNAILKLKSEISYWALVHTKTNPDFHDSASFILERAIP